MPQYSQYDSNEPDNITLQLTEGTLTALVVPVGCVLPWFKSFTGVPQTLPDCFMECDGSEVIDTDSPLYGETLPDLNGNNQFLRGNSTSGGTGGTETHSHTTSGLKSSTGYLGSANKTPNADTLPTTTVSNLPPYYNVVWIIRIK